MIAARKTLVCNNENGVKLERDFGRFDMVIHFGLLYQLDQWTTDATPVSIATTGP